MGSGASGGKGKSGRDVKPAKTAKSVVSPAQAKEKRLYKQVDRWKRENKNNAWSAANEIRRGITGRSSTSGSNIGN